MTRSVADEMASLRSAKIAAEGQLAALTSIIKPVRDLPTDLAELVNYAMQCRAILGQFPVVIDQLRAHQARDVQAIGNSLDALFRSVPVPAVLAAR